MVKKADWSGTSIVMAMPVMMMIMMMVVVVMMMIMIMMTMRVVAVVVVIKKLNDNSNPGPIHNCQNAGFGAPASRKHGKTRGFGNSVRPEPRVLRVLR